MKKKKERRKKREGGGGVSWGWVRRLLFGCVEGLANQVSCQDMLAGYAASGNLRLRQAKRKQQRG